jgi:hypothetical protein
MTSSRLSKVFGVHRFAAGAFAIQLFFLSDTVGHLASPGELLANQCWACFIAIVAYTVHQARSFRIQDQMGIGMSLLASFVLEAGVMIYYLVTAEVPEESYMPLVGTAGFFVVISLAYMWALMEPIPMVTDGVPAAPKNLMTTVLTIHRIAMNMLALILLLYPTSAFKMLFHEAPSTSVALLTTQAWGCFVLAIANFAHVASTFPSASSRNSVACGMVVGFAPLTCLYGYQISQGKLPVGAGFILMASCLVAYTTALLVDAMKKKSD